MRNKDVIEIATEFIEILHDWVGGPLVDCEVNPQEVAEATEKVLLEIIESHKKTLSEIVRLREFAKSVVNWEFRDNDDPDIYENCIIVEEIVRCCNAARKALERPKHT